MVASVWRSSAWNCTEKGQCTKFEGGILEYITYSLDKILPPNFPLSAPFADVSDKGGVVFELDEIFIVVIFVLVDPLANCRSASPFVMIVGGKEAVATRPTGALRGRSSPAVLVSSPEDDSSVAGLPRLGCSQRAAGACGRTSAASVDIDVFARRPRTQAGSGNEIGWWLGLDWMLAASKLPLPGRIMR